jgi:hypothetical protein
MFTETHASHVLSQKRVLVITTFIQKRPSNSISEKLTVAQRVRVFRPQKNFFIPTQVPFIIFAASLSL